MWKIHGTHLSLIVLNDGLLFTFMKNLLTPMRFQSGAKIKPLQILLTIVTPTYYFASIDLKDAYCSLFFLVIKILCLYIFAKWIVPMDFNLYQNVYRPRSAVGNMSGNRCESDCRSRGREFDRGPVPYFHGD